MIDDEGGGILNAEEIEAAKTMNRELAQAWIDCVSDCEEQASGDFEGVHFHWLMSGVDQGEIESIAGSGGDEGSTPNGGNTSEPDADTAYDESGCYQDMQETYEKFISLKYSYAFTEFQARDGYIRHDLHADDIPVEIITTDSSEAGANAFFAGEYSKRETLENGVSGYSNRTRNVVMETLEEKKEAEPIRKNAVKQLFQEAKMIAQDIVTYIAPEVIADENETISVEEQEERPSEPVIKAEQETITEENVEMTESTEKNEQIEESEKSTGDEEPEVEISSRPPELVQAVYGKSATPSSAEDKTEFQFLDEDKEMARAASPSDAATPSEAAFRWNRRNSSFRNPDVREMEGIVSELFQPAYEEALSAESSGSEADSGPDDNYSHCNNADREGNAWRVYDHRTEGEFHIIKKDLDLAAGETDNYSAYGEAQGDGTLEGAVYGLFAAEDISHPDGKTGVVYRANNLVAIATTDKNGDASFLVNTEAPGRTYDYQKGAVVDTGDGWREEAPKNLYQSERTYDDYSEDGQYRRQYTNNEANNGNCWIGRPLLMGDYYVKELSRSEGYELSIGNRADDVTNFGQDLEVKAPEESEGYAVITQQLFADEQTSDDGTGAGPNELFFAARSKDTKEQKYDIVLSGLPKGAEFYRREEGTRQIEVQVGTGTYEKVLLTNPDGSPRYIRAENDYQYLKYNADGSPMMKEMPINYVAERFRQVTVRPLDEAVIQAALNKAEGEMTEDENQSMLAETFTAGNLLFVKGKVEKALRKNGKSTPGSPLPGGGYHYSTIDTGEFDTGVRQGEEDRYGLSGVFPGSQAAYTVYGSPVQKIAIAKQRQDGTALTVGDAILSILNYYDSNPYYSYGGIDAVEASGSDYIFTVYAGVGGNPENFMVLGNDPVTDSIIYHAVPYIPGDSSLPPRYIYAAYSNHPDYAAFGTYEDYQEGASGTSAVGSATLITDAVADQDGNLHSKMVKENVYYQSGELVRDSSGALIQAFEYREVTKTEQQEVQDVKWQKIPAERKADGTYVLPVNAVYTDSYGTAHTNAGQDQTIEFKAVLKEKEVILSAEDVAVLGAGFVVGHPMNSASYYAHVKQARAKAYLDYQNMNLVGDNTYVILTSLAYPGQEKLYQDGGTREQPAQVLERAIRQKIKIVKDIQTTPEGTYAHNTNADAGHQDRFTKGPGGRMDNASKLPNFRFKLYLNSNLERLYRNEAGEIAWLDRDGKEVDITSYRAAYPEKEPFASVQKFYTKALHKGKSLTTGSINNNVWNEAVTVNESLYSYDGNGMIEESQNTGYTRLLETRTQTMEDGAGQTREVKSYNYDKFFDALQTANHDKWDRKENASTSYKPFAFIRESIFGIEGGEKAYPAVHNNAETANRANTSEPAKENAKRSDAVRQFAITWYLDDEVKKITEDNGAGERQAAGAGETYQEENYDKALLQAILKAENYLKPFFTYDLDEIYSIAWDSEADGGSDRDRTTLAADTLQKPAVSKSGIQSPAGNGLETSKDGYFYGVSKYLPYGAYIAVEQQPYSAKLGDFYNKHYKTDKPKEIILPALYEDGGNVVSPEKLSDMYRYASTDTPEILQKKYHIRMNEEWSKAHTDDLRNYVIRAHNQDGDFEVYKYGLAADKLTGKITYPGSDYSYQGFTVTQEAFDPYKDVYEGENAASDYRSNQKVEKYYHYASLSERAGTTDDVLFPYGPAADEDNPSGFYFKDGVKSITGALTGYDGLYFAALVPWSVTEPVNAADYNGAAFSGYADGKYRNTFYTSRLRIEKLDSETGETILHDSAIFALYSAEREDGQNSDGRVKFYEQDTVISGSKEFLEAMGAEDITPLARPSLPWQVPYNGKYYGTVSAGTPICKESEMIIMTDATGEKTGQFKSYTTTKDRGKANGSQNVGYLETPQPLGAGCYVLCEIKAPAGYVRSRPVAIEIYSDEVNYYLDGERDNRVAAAIYEETNGNKPEDTGDVARLYLNNTPIRLEVTKAKPDEDKVNYELNGRLEGSITELKGRHGLENLELAYNSSGAYLGYGWKKGFLDALKAKQAAGEIIEILYEDGVFTGKARLEKQLNTAGDTNRYLPGAVMTLYDAIEVKANGDSEDFQFDGVNVERDRYGNVTKMYVQKGFAGTQIKFVLDKTEPDSDGLTDFEHYTYDDQEDDKGEGTWSYKTVEREDTDILYYDLGGLDVLTEEKGILYGHDKNAKKIRAKNGEPIYALKSGTPFLEIICPDYEELKYNEKDHVFETVPEGTELFHLDADKNRDSRVTPYTGMAYVEEEPGERILVWPVRISKDQYGNVIAREKITTSRITTINADTEDEFTIGTYKDGAFRKEMNPVLNEHGQPDYYQKSEEKYSKGGPVYDRDGDYVRYRYDDKLKAYNDNAWRIDTNRDLLDIGAEPEQEKDDRPLNRRQGESYIIPNTWTTGEAAPDDPFRSDMTDGQVDVLKRVPAGLYILEEVKAPNGYVKAMPMGLEAPDGSEIKRVKMTDQPVSGYFEKLDAPESFRVRVIDKDQILEETEFRTEGKGSFSYGGVAGAGLALFRARRTGPGSVGNPSSGYRLEKTEETPATWTALDEQNREKTFTAQWVTGAAPQYLEAIPKGLYILEETDAPSGYVGSSMEIEIRENEELQYFVLPNDHTKLEIYKYLEADGRRQPVSNSNPAEFALYDAENNLADEWTTDDCREYTSVVDTSVYRKTGISDRLRRIFNPGRQLSPSGFTCNYEEMFSQYGTGFDSLSWETERLAVRESSSDNVFRTSNGFKIIVGEDTLIFQEGMEPQDREGFIRSYSNDENALTVGWLAKRSAKRIFSDNTEKNESVRQLWETDTGKQILICAGKNLTSEGTGGYVYDYKFNYKKLESGHFPNAVSYDTPAGNHRFDYIPRGAYRLVEQKAPDGFEKAEDRILNVEETADIQLYSVKNKPLYLYIDKVSEDGKSLAGAELALYRSDGSGNFRKENQYLEDTWISGDEGFYTMEDYYDGTIPDGFLAGEMKPHRIGFLTDGIYYLAEHRAPEGFARMEPQKIEIPGDRTENGILHITARNRLKKGKIRIEKEASDSGKKLPGARFEVKNCNTGELYSIITDEKGCAELTGLRTGEVKDGKWTPDRYTIREVAAPEKYALSSEIKTFCFDGREDGETLVFTWQLKNEPTDIGISKSDFYTGEFVKGARLAIYQAAEEDGTYVPFGEPVEEWISDGTRHRVKGKLAAGGVYFLKELKSPAGYLKAKPVLFVLSDDGRKISSIHEQERSIEIKTAGPFQDAVEEVSIQGRKAVKTEVWLTCLETGETIVVPSYQTAPLTAADGIKQDALYEEKEITFYTDQNSRITRRLVFRMNLDAAEEYRPNLRTAEKTILKAETSGGGLLEEWEVENREGFGYRHIICNPEYEEKTGIKTAGDNGKYGAAVMPDTVIKYEITCKNTQKEKKDIKVTAYLDPQTEFMPANSEPGWREGEEGAVTMALTGVLPGEERKIILTAAVKKDAKEKILCRAQIGNAVFRQENPIAGEGSLSVVTRLSGTASSQFEGREGQYRLVLSDEAGTQLRGSFRYTGDREGVIKSGGVLTLGGGEHVVITGIPWNTSYRVEEITEPESRAEFSEREIGAGEINTGELSVRKSDTAKFSTAKFNTEGTTGRKAASAVFLYKMNDDSVRELLKKGDTFRLTEVIHYSDGDELVTGKTAFLLDDAALADGLDMKDQPVRVLFGKTEVNGVDELPGAHFQLKDESGTILDEWISDGQLHETSASLEPGKTYCLTEISPPKGYARAEDLCFTVSDDGADTLIRVSDRPTRVAVSKISAETEEGLAGAELEITDESGSRIERWVSDGTAHVLKGKLEAGKTYILREITAPDGYRRAEPVTFTVSEDGSEDQVVMEDVPTRVLFEKIGLEADGTTQTGLLGGALIRIEDRRGREVYRFLSRDDAAHEVTGILKEGETYTAIEEEVPYGYERAEPVNFTVPSEGGAITVQMKDRKKPENPPDKTGKDSHFSMILHKYDGVTMKGLPGAEFAIYYSDGRFLKNISAGDGGRVQIELPGPGTYIAVEIKAPQGYSPSPDEYRFTVTGKGSAGGSAGKEIQIPNYPLSEKAGFITVHYGRNLKGTGNIFLKRKRLSPLAPAGDSGSGAGEFILAVLLLCGIIVLWSRRRKRSREDKKE